MKHCKGIKKLLSLAGCQLFLKTLKQKEKTFFFIFLFCFFFSLIFLCLNFYFENTEIKPIKGGVYVEGTVGSPIRINPLYAQENDVDRDLTELIYSGLMKYNEKGELVPDLAIEYHVLDDGKIIDFILKENVFWSDGTALTVDDIIFTIKAIQNPALKSHIRASWLSVETEKISDQQIRFKLRTASTVFLENCTLKIMPKHIWQDVAEQNFPFSVYNLEPIGSGPYKIKEIKQNKENNVTSIELTTNNYYHGEPAYISRVIFNFFKNENEVISAFNSGKINGFSLSSLEKYQNLRNSNFNKHSLIMPRYFALFLNAEKEKLLADSKIKQALSHGINKQELIDQVLSGQGEKVDSPVLTQLYQLENPLTFYSFDQEKANQLLDQTGFVKQENNFREKLIEEKPDFQFKSDLEVGAKNKEVEELQKCLAQFPDIYPEKEVTGYFGQKTKQAVILFQEKYAQEILAPSNLSAGNGKVLAGTRKKLNEVCNPVSGDSFPLSFSLVTVDQPILTETAFFLKNSWQSIGINLEIEIVSIAEIKEIIKARDYQILLFGQMLGMYADPFPFWHSSQTKDPGLNLSLYENEKVDKILEETRQTLDQDKRKANLEKFQDIIIQDLPAIFLYNPNYIYLMSKNIKGFDSQIIVDPSKRLINIENWYIQTKRKWK
jgi:ABC-type transport system substrate-binding protein